MSDDKIVSVVEDAKTFINALTDRARARVDPQMHIKGEIPTGYVAKGTSVLYNAAGEVQQYWVKSREDQDDPAAIVAAFRAYVEGGGIPARPPVPPPPPLGDDDILSVYAFGDPHIGMLAWALETGDDFDLKIAEQLMCDATDKLVSLAPPSKRAIVLSPGDTLHSDGLDAQTTKRGHVLDMDSRLGKVFRVAMTTITRCIDRTLECHDEVHGMFVPGNHDATMSALLPLMLDFYYRENPRVTIDTTPSPFMKYRFGKVLLATTHTDNVKMNDLESVMACDWAKDWGETEFRHWYCGHLHHKKVQEYRGCTAEVLPTLAGKDSWHHKHGYRAARTMKLDVWHRDYGLQVTHQVGVKELRAA